MGYVGHFLSLEAIVKAIVHALHLRGVTNLNSDFGRGGHRAWIETAHWIITVRSR